MSVIAAYIYGDGKRRREINLDAPESLELAEGEFAWIGLLEPNEDELRVLQDRFDLHPWRSRTRSRPVNSPQGRCLWRSRSSWSPARPIWRASRSATARPTCSSAPTIIYRAARLSAILQRLAPAIGDSARAPEAWPGLHPARGARFHCRRLFPHRRGDRGRGARHGAACARCFPPPRGNRPHLHSAARAHAISAILGPMEEVASRLEHHEMPCVDFEVRPLLQRRPRSRPPGRLDGRDAT